MAISADLRISQSFSPCTHRDSAAVLHIQGLVVVPFKHLWHRLRIKLSLVKVHPVAVKISMCEHK